MFDVGGGELLMILLGVLVLFGPKKIPELAQMLGKGIQKVRQAQSQFQSEINEIQSGIQSFTEPSNPAYNNKTTRINEIENEDNISEIQSNIGDITSTDDHPDSIPSGFTVKKPIVQHNIDEISSYPTEDEPVI